MIGNLFTSGDKKLLVAVLIIFMIGLTIAIFAAVVMALWPVFVLVGLIGAGWYIYRIQNPKPTPKQLYQKETKTLVDNLQKKVPAPNLDEYRNSIIDTLFSDYERVDDYFKSIVTEGVDRFVRSAYVFDSTPDTEDLEEHARIRELVKQREKLLDRGITEHLDQIIVDFYTPIIAEYQRHDELFGTFDVQFVDIANVPRLIEHAYAMVDKYHDFFAICRLAEVLSDNLETIQGDVSPHAHN